MSRRTVPDMSRFSSRAKAQTSSINPIEEKPREVSEIMLYNGSTVVFGNMLLNRVSYEEARLVYQSGARLWSALSENIHSLRKGMLVSKKECRLSFGTLVPFGEWHEHLTQVIGAGFFTPHYWAVIS